ncbi:hypothetical protein FE783_15060 [Paenibacillus mesophilus]|uniref:hypothetical protein n=1 Tax=Paenibacillus mesophilus TaxID=2582849 RepID=UPI00110D65DC|nr:hypothetical protein [Paenibacillus mesophilus]TMV48989.1 hypothetical protein FE783_15060 [Paenibacillus mesophilus]
MSEQLLSKLRYKEGAAAVWNAPEGYDLGIGIGGIEEPAEGGYDFALLYVNNFSEVEQWVPKLLPTLKEDALFWVSYPKQSAKTKEKPDINRDILAAWVQDHTPYRVVSNVAVDEKWSALRLRPQDKVKPGKRT